MLETSHDLNIKYQNTFVKNEDKVVIIEEFLQEDSNEPIQVVFRSLAPNGTLKTIGPVPYEHEDFDLSLPKLGFINTRDSVVKITRRHKRDSNSRYRRSLHLDTITMKDICYTEMVYLNLAPPSIYSIMYSLFNNIFPSWQESLQEVKSLSKLSSAFTPTLAIKINGITNSIELIKNDWSLGQYNPIEDLFDLDINMFNQELLELGIPFRRKYGSII